jgi:hypothetical protein
MWRPKAKLSPEAAQAKIDDSAAFIQDLHESLERFFEKSARRAEADKPKITVLGLLGAILSARAEDISEGDAKSGDVNPRRYSPQSWHATPAESPQDKR